MKRKSRRPEEPQETTAERCTSSGTLAQELATVTTPAPFASCYAYEVFAEIVRRHARYFRSTNTVFLETLLRSARTRTKRIAKGTLLCRAQLGAGPTKEVLNDEEMITIDDSGPLSAARMKPTGDHAAAGRANPRGIPYLYLASGPDIARAEVRPWLGSKVSLGRFETVRELNVIDCTMDAEQRYLFHHPNCEKTCTPEARERGVWTHINAAFSRPVGREDDELAYLPTQVIAEFFKNEGFDGIIYKSAYGPGENIVLFELEAAELTACFLFQTKAIEFTYDEAANPYFRKPNPETGESSFVRNRIGGFRKTPKRRKPRRVAVRKRSRTK